MNKLVLIAILILTQIFVFAPASPAMAQEDKGHANYARFDLQVEAKLPVKGELVARLGDSSQETVVFINTGETTVASLVFPFVEGSWQIDLVTEDEGNILHLNGTLSEVTGGYSAQFTTGSTVDTSFLNFPADKYNLTIIVGYVSGSLSTSINLRQSLDCLIRLGLDADADGTISEQELSDFNVSGTELIGETPFLTSIPPTVRYYVGITRGGNTIAEAKGLYDLLNEQELAFADGYQFVNRELASVFNIVMRRNPYVAVLALPNRDVIPGPIVAAPEEQGDNTVGIMIRTNFNSVSSDNVSSKETDQVWNRTPTAWIDTTKAFFTDWWLPLAIVLGVLFGLILLRGMLRRVLR